MTDVLVQFPEKRSFNFEEIERTSYEIDEVDIAVREVGSGPTLMFLHGFPAHSITWQKILPTLARHFRCVLVDLPGLGESYFKKNADITLTAQATRLKKLIFTHYAPLFGVVAHGVGGALARLVAASETKLVKKLVLINTEIPHHRPALFGFYRDLLRTQDPANEFRSHLNSPVFVRSSVGFGEFYSDKNLLSDPENLAPYLQPLLASEEKLKGAMSFMRGFDWRLIDDLAELHSAIRADTLLLWGQDDRLFPVEKARDMLDQFLCKKSLYDIPKASLMPHEEKPFEVVDALLDWFWD